MGFKDRIAAYNAQKDTKVNPPEAKTVLETKSEPEVANVKAEAPPASEEKASSVPSGAAPAAAAESSETASAEAPKAKGRGRPAGSKNSPKPPTAATSTEATSASVPTTAAPVATDDPTAAARALLALPGKDGRAFAVEAGVLVEALFLRGYGVTRL